MNATFYDHAKNHGNVAQGYAVAMARRDAISDGTAYRVEFNWTGGKLYYWDGAYHAALSLAKSCHSNKADSVKMIGPKGEQVDILNAKY